jgi:trans-aconitate methyltransferase
MVRQMRPKTIYVGTTGVKEYRATIGTYVRPEDVVLEVGCEWGTTTDLIEDVTKSVIGTDISPECIERAREMRPHIRFEAIDAFDMPALLALDMPFSKIYMDLSGFSGYAALLDVLSLLNMYTYTLQPEVIVVKSRSLKTFAHRCVAWRDPAYAEDKE